jgi:hypothetical protein
MSELNRIVEVLTRVDEDGNDVHSAAHIRHALPYLAIALDLPLEELSEGMQALIHETLMAAGGTLEGMLQYYEDCPPDSRIIDDVRRALAGDRLGDARDRGLSAQLGLDVSHRPVGSAPRPPGAVSGSLARLYALPLPQKKKR